VGIVSRSPAPRVAKRPASGADLLLLLRSWDPVGGPSAAGSWFVEFFSGLFLGVMGAFCSCLQADYSDHHGNETSGAFRNCMCLRCFTQQLINAVSLVPVAWCDKD
uniref:Uncharacterized protein n=1 Tax=Aegilops tauschii subsp. strangulata TaxID=200361 RepID=A0A453HX31_AEGTS